MSTPCYDSESSLAIDAAIESAMAEPKRMKGDMGEVENHSISDLIALDKYRRAKCAGATGNTGFGLRTVQGKPPGAI